MGKAGGLGQWAGARTFGERVLRACTPEAGGCGLVGSRVWATVCVRQPSTAGGFEGGHYTESTLYDILGGGIQHLTRAEDWPWTDPFSQGESLVGRL